MSTYYYFHCTKHQASGGEFTRQAWGAGNADLIDTFKFVMYHVLECGPESIGIHSEHDDDDYAATHYGVDDESRRQFLKETRHIFPRSNDWGFMQKVEPGQDHNELWVAAELAALDHHPRNTPDELANSTDE